MESKIESTPFDIKNGLGRRELAQAYKEGVGALGTDTASNKEKQCKLKEGILGLLVPIINRSIADDMISKCMSCEGRDTPQ